MAIRMTRTKKPLSQTRLAANRANASRSTGPRTPQGKARSAQNARKHGFTASTFAVVRLEDLHEVAHLRADLIAVYQPVNSQELFAIERVAVLGAGDFDVAVPDEFLVHEDHGLGAKASTVWQASPTVGPSSCAIRPRPNATTAAPSKSSNGSKPCGLNYQTNPSRRPNPNQRKTLAPCRNLTHFSRRPRSRRQFRARSPPPDRFRALLQHPGQ
jgi:hypothetical protein